jgi:hypothetical protein
MEIGQVDLDKKFPNIIHVLGWFKCDEQIIIMYVTNNKTI